jgi:AcrR family transcriptional regulator
MKQTDVEIDCHGRILNAARSVFGRFGFHRARMDDIALAASVSKGSLYNHFKDKEDLFQRLVEGVMVYDLNLATSDCPPHAAALQRLDQLLDALFWRVARICRDDGLIFNIWAAAAHGHSGFERAVSSAHQQWHEAIKDVLDDGRERGEFGPGLDTEAAASLIMAAANGVIVNRRFSSEDDLVYLNRLRHGLLLAVSAW